MTDWKQFGRKGLLEEVVVWTRYALDICSEGLSKVTRNFNQITGAIADILFVRLRHRAEHYRSINLLGLVTPLISQPVTN
jgi:hypothetical protein